MNIIDAANEWLVSDSEDVNEAEAIIEHLVEDLTLANDCIVDQDKKIETLKKNVKWLNRFSSCNKEGE